MPTAMVAILNLEIVIFISCVGGRPRVHLWLGVWYRRETSISEDFLGGLDWNGIIPMGGYF